MGANAGAGAARGQSGSDAGSASASTAGASAAADGGGSGATAAANGGGHSGDQRAGTGASGATGAGATAGANAAAGSGAEAGGRAGSVGASGGSGGSNSATFRCPPGPYAQPVPSGATPERIQGVPPLDAFNDTGSTRTNLEGAVWIGDTLYVSEFPLTAAPTSRVLAIATEGPGSSASVAIAITDCGSNGMAVDGAGNLISADHLRGAVLRYSFPLGTPTTIVANYDGKRFNSPNDLAVRSDGNIYFSDPDYQAPSMHPQAQTRLYRIPPGSSTVQVIDATRSEPNGVTLSIDERTLYVSGSDGIFSYSIQDDGDIAAGGGVRITGFTGGADGLAIDCAGNLYATSGTRVVVLSPAGTQIASIPVSNAEDITNLAFGGIDHKTLFITGMGTGQQRGVFRVALGVPGMPY